MEAVRKQRRRNEQTIQDLTTELHEERTKNRELSMQVQALQSDRGVGHDFVYPQSVSHRHTSTGPGVPAAASPLRPVCTPSPRHTRRRTEHVCTHGGGRSMSALLPRTTHTAQ